jgi:raffinose/stachyose/melibiose transport system substrate-binding protein
MLESAHSPRRGVSRRLRLAVIVGVAASALAACSLTPGATNAPETRDDQPISTVVPDGEPISLTLTHFEADGTGEAITKLIEAFEAAHPNVTIEPRYSAFADYGKNIKLVMSSNDPPDIAQVGQAHVMMGPLVQAGLLRPLDDYAQAYGWADRFSPGLLDQLRFTPDGLTFGQGELYGASLGGNLVGVYYNREKLARLGIDPAIPDLATFVAALEAAKAAGEVPIQLGNLEGWPGNHLLTDLIARYDDVEAIRSWIYGEPGTTLDRPGVKQAANTLQSWVQAGYITPSANGTAYEDGTTKFINGEGVFMITGNWAQARIDEEMAGNAGFMLLPPVSAGDPARATAALTSPFGISTRTEHPDVAAAFINFMISAEAAPELLAGGYLPALRDSAATAPAGTAQEGTLAGWQQVAAADGQALYVDWATPSMGDDTLFPEVQRLLGGQQTADGLIAAVQADWAEFQADK